MHAIEKSIDSADLSNLFSTKVHRKISQYTLTYIENFTEKFQLDALTEALTSDIIIFHN